MQLIERDERGLFASANTAYGFQSYFAEIFGDASRRVILKGGPGCGKSHLMKAIAAESEARGEETVRYYCSSDADSLDGLILPERGIAILDGTAPHIFDPIDPGAVDEILWLGECWDRGVLAARAGEITGLRTQKKECYRTAYAMLAARGNVENACRDLMERSLRRDAVERFAAEICSRLHACSGRIAYGNIESVGMQGRVRYRDFEKRADSVTRLEVAGGILTAAIYRELLRTGKSAAISFSPLAPEDPDAILLPDGRAFIVGGSAGDGETPLPLADFLADSPAKASLARLRAAADALDAVIHSVFSEIAAHHFALERIYGTAMDFAAVDARIERLKRELF